MNHLFPRMIPGLVAAQLQCVGRKACVMPLVAGALAGAAGAVTALFAGPGWAAGAAIVLVPLHSLVVALAATSALAGDPLVELQGSTAAGMRAVQTARAALCILGGMAGAFAMFAPLHLLGAVHGGAGWAGALTPVGGAALFVLAAYAAAAAAGNLRGMTLFVVLAWIFLSFFWDPNLAEAPALQRGVPLVVAAVAAAGAWLSLGSSERACAKAVGAR